MKRAKSHPLPKPRNPHGASPLLRKGGAHGKSTGAKRRAQNVAVKMQAREKDHGE